VVALTLRCFSSTVYVGSLFLQFAWSCFDGDSGEHRVSSLGILSPEFCSGAFARNLMQSGTKSRIH
jgi:hypothetical protein